MLNNKGNILDWFLIVVFLLLLSITLFASFIVVDKVNDSGIFTDDVIADNAINQARNSLLNMDTLFLFIIVGLSLFVLISSAVVNNHPAMFIISLFLLLIAIVIAGVISNTFWVFSNSDTILSTAGYFPKISFLMNKLPMYILFMGIAAAIAMYVGKSDD